MMESRSGDDDESPRGDDVATWRCTILSEGEGDGKIQ